MRDDFPKRVLETLAKRVGYRCSNPECRKPTSGPHTEDSKSLNVGVGAHITAASPSGARYDPCLTSMQRRAGDNGVWLCQNCGKLVDNDETRFPVGLLREWRQIAEEAALKEIQSAQALPAIQDGHSIHFAVDDWKLWRERGNLPGDRVAVISGWKRGEIRYSCTVRFRNKLDWEEQLHRFRADFRKVDQTLFSDIYVVERELVVLPSRQWVSVDICHGLRDRELAEAAESVWLVAETVGNNQRFEWLLAKLAIKVDDLEEG